MQFDAHTLVLLMLSPTAPQHTEEEANAVQDAHLAFVADMVEQGLIAAAGPPLGADDDRLRGVGLWTVSVDEARELAAKDPAVQCGRLIPQFAAWMVPAGQVRFGRAQVPRSMAEVGQEPQAPVTAPNAARLERTYDAGPDLIWDLLTTAAGLDEWFAPAGFECRVSELELRPGGPLRYTLTATSPEQLAFLREIGQPLSVEVRKTFTEVAPRGRLAFLSLIDFVPDHEPYEHLTTIDIEPAGDRTKVVMTLDPLHDEAWTGQHRAHRADELDNLGAAIRRRAV